jgi:hypothetical protein
VSDPLEMRARLVELHGRIVGGDVDYNPFDYLDALDPVIVKTASELPSGRLVTARLLDGSELEGEFAGADDEEARFDVDGEQVAVPLRSILTFLIPASSHGPE